MSTLNLAIPLATVQDTFFGPPSFPAGPTASYVEARARANECDTKKNIDQTNEGVSRLGNAW